MTRRTTVVDRTPRSVDRASRSDRVIAVVIAASDVPTAVGRRVVVGRRAIVLERTAQRGHEDSRMSRQHATVRRAPGASGVIVRDGALVDDEWKSSANGTWKGDEEIVEPREIEPGDTFQTGNTLWVVVVNPSVPSGPTLMHGISEAMGQARDELELVTSQVALRLDRNKRVGQALLVTGPRGTGKQVVAREAHRLMTQKRKPHPVPFRQVAAPALADGTTGADLFGVVGGYATDVKARDGYFQQAHGGVLFLDEVADTPAGEQAKLLNVLQEREVTPLGGQQVIPFDCLIVAATNRDLERMASEGAFRRDLIDRIGRYVVHLPPLSERREDIPFLVHVLLERHGWHDGIDASAMDALIRQPWPGSVRDLDACVERIVAMAEIEDVDEIDPPLVARALAAIDRAAPASSRPSAPDRRPVPAGSRRRPSRSQLVAVLEETGWNKTEVARRYGKHPRQVTRWMQYMDIERPDDTDET